MINYLSLNDLVGDFSYVCCTLMLSFILRDDVVKALNDAIDRREEGLVIKSPSSIYKPNLRNGKL